MKRFGLPYNVKFFCIFNDGPTTLPHETDNGLFPSTLNSHATNHTSLHSSGRHLMILLMDRIPTKSTKKNQRSN